MKTLGIIGGIAPESTIEYYRLLVAEYRRRQPDGSYPSILINSVNLQRLIDLVTADDRAGLVEYLVPELEKLHRGGAVIGLLSSNTPHLVFDQLAARSPLPLISIVTTARAEAQRLGLKRVGLFGTRFTMQAGFYTSTFAEAGITVVVPEAAEREAVHEKYMGELIHGRFLDETRERLLGIALAMQQREGIEALVLGGTELPLLLRESPAGLPLLDTGRLHAEAAVAQMLA